MGFRELNEGFEDESREEDRGPYGEGFEVEGHASLPFAKIRTSNADRYSALAARADYDTGDLWSQFRYYVPIILGKVCETRILRNLDENDLIWAPTRRYNSL